MKETTPDIIASIHLLTTDEGGRKMPIVHQMFGCIFSLGEKNYDCRLLLDGKGDVWPGQKLTVPIKFLDSEHACPAMHIGANFQLLEGNVIARGIIEEVIQK